MRPDLCRVCCCWTHDVHAYVAEVCHGCVQDAEFLLVEDGIPVNEDTLPRKLDQLAAQRMDDAEEDEREAAEFRREHGSTIARLRREHGRVAS